MMALELIRQGWTQHTFARDENEKAVRFTDPNAVKWCSTGAIGAVYPGTREYISAIEKLMQWLPTEVFSISFWNDAPERTHAEVISAFEKAGI
jgi:hypothetical protein